MRQVGHRIGLVTAIAGQITGALLLASSVRVLTLLGAALLGLGSALIIQLVPAALGARHPRFTTAILGEANAVSSFASLLAPAAVAGAIGLGSAGRPGTCCPRSRWPSPCSSSAVAAAGLGADVGCRRPASPSQRPDSGLEAGRFLPRWIALLFAISVEFCLVFWAADAFAEWHGVGPAAAPVLAAMFLLGMASVRAASSRLTAGRHPAGRHPGRLWRRDARIRCVLGLAEHPRCGDRSTGRGRRRCPALPGGVGALGRGLADDRDRAAAGVLWPPVSRSAVPRSCWPRCPTPSVCARPT